MNDSADKSNAPLVLRPKARILRTLGEELISSETVALIELVKNAYDADAENVLILFEGELVEGKGSISVIDDGHGMDMATIHDSWMVIATSSKKSSTTSRSGTRRVLGEKGIGRFATARIARELELFTRTISQKQTESYAIFDWSQFDNDELFLEEIEFLAEEQDAKFVTTYSPIYEYKDESTHARVSGTYLKMNRLKHTWERKDLEQLRRGLSRLISPFHSNSDFNIYVQLPPPHDELATKISPPEIIDYPHYKAAGAIEGDGKFSYQIEVLETQKKAEFEGKFIRALVNDEWVVVAANSERDDQIESESAEDISCGAIQFELRVWDRDDLENVVQKVGGGIRSIRKDLDAIAGINIYRDGFRVLPYGEPDNDWLRLDLRRVQNPTRNLSNNQITGYISISADENPLLHDRSNREGLDNNSAYADLQNMMMQVLSEIENSRFKAKRRDGSTATPHQDEPGMFEMPDFESVVESIKKDESKQTTLELVSKVEADWRSQIKKVQVVLSQYHALATLGGIVDKILHDGRQPLAKIQMEAGLGKETAEQLSGSQKDSKATSSVVKSFKTIVTQSSVLSDVLRRAEPFGGRKRGRQKKYYIEELIKDYFALYERELEKAKIRTDLPSTDTLVTIDQTELSEILTNLITNSIYWLHSVPEDEREIRVHVERQDEGPLELVFSDTGPGVHPEDRDQIFTPYFSKKPDGHGLGLCLVGEIVKDYYGGSAELLDSGKQRGAVFRLTFNRRV